MHPRETGEALSKSGKIGIMWLGLMIVLFFVGMYFMKKRALSFYFLSYENQMDTGGYWSKDYTIAIGNSVSIDPMPVKANITVTHGASNAGNFNGLNDELREAFNIRR